MELNDSKKGIKNGIITIGIQIANKHGEKKEKSLKKQMKDVRSLTEKQVIEMGAIAKSWLSSGNHKYIAVAISFFTGRRLIEIYKTGFFSKSKSKNTLIFEGQAKKENAKPYEIPVSASNVTTSEIIKAMKEVKALAAIDFGNLDKLTNEEIEHIS